MASECEQGIGSMTDRLLGLRVLVVEDESLIAELIADVLETAGCSILGPFPQLTEALQAAEAEHFDTALLDIDLGGSHSYPIADALARRNLPFAFLTGHGRGGLPAQYSKRPIVGKPFTSKDILDTLARALETPPGT
jgi:CheY-like chemotaxis protein